MPAPERSVPDVDVDGFVALDDFAARVRHLNPADVAHMYAVPGLLVTSVDRSVVTSLDRSVGASLDRSVGASLDRSVGASLPDAHAAHPGAKPGQEVPLKRLEESYRTTANEDSPVPDPVAVQIRYAGRVGFLTKRPGNHFPDMCSIGRALNCDLILALTSVSKIHGLFHREAQGRWTFSDQASRNGTFINGRRLTPGDRHPIREGETIQIGLHFAAVFVSATSLLSRLRPGR